MPHITLSVSEDVYMMMRRHREIRWSEVARAAIAEYAKSLSERSSGREILEALPSESRRFLNKIGEREARKFYRKVAEKDWKRVRSLTQAS